MDDRIRALFATMMQVAPDQITDDTRPDNFEKWDSMQHLILVSGFEEEFELDLEPEDAVDMYADFATFRRIVLQKMESR